MKSSSPRQLQRTPIRQRSERGVASPPCAEPFPSRVGCCPIRPRHLLEVWLFFMMRHRRSSLRSFGARSRSNPTQGRGGRDTVRVVPAGESPLHHGLLLLTLLFLGRTVPSHEASYRSKPFASGTRLSVIVPHVPSLQFSLTATCATFTFEVPASYCSSPALAVARRTRSERSCRMLPASIPTRRTSANRAGRPPCGASHSLRVRFPSCHRPRRRSQ